MPPVSFKHRGGEGSGTNGSTVGAGVLTSDLVGAGEGGGVGVSLTHLPFTAQNPGTQSQEPATHSVFPLEASQLKYLQVPPVFL